MSSRSDSSLDCLVPVQGPDGSVLRVTGFVEPRHLVGLAAVAHRVTGRSSTVPPRLEVTDPDSASYLARMHLGRVLTGLGCAHRLPAIGERRLGDRLLELTEVHEPDQVRHLGALVRRRLRGREAGVVTALYDAVTELGLNVHLHADPGVRHLVTGYAAAQTMSKGDEIVFAIADYGVGMLGTLGPRGAVDDQAAIELALAGNSRFPDRVAGGLGLRTTARLVSALGGSLYLASGEASVTVRAGRRSWSQLPSAYAGTLLQARVPMH